MRVDEWWKNFHPADSRKQDYLAQGILYVDK